MLPTINANAAGLHRAEAHYNLHLSMKAAQRGQLHRYLGKQLANYLLQLSSPLSDPDLTHQG
jgi:hypothetical protein